MLTQRQNALYWREWAAAKRALMPGRETWTKHEENERRHEQHALALGDDKSHVDFTNDDFDRILGQFRSISRPGDLNAQLHALNGQRHRLLHRIRNMDSADYIQGIIDRMNAEGKLGGLILEELHPSDLVKVLIALRKQDHRERAVAREVEMPF